MSDKQEASQAEIAAYEVRAPRKRGCLGHLKRFWWVYLLGFICTAVVAVCLIIFVAVPKIAQSKIDAAILEVQGINVLNITPDSYTMEINSTITSDGSIHADIDAFEGSMYLEDVPGHTPFARIQFPPTTAAKLQVVNVSQVVQIDDRAAFKEFNVWLVNNASTTVTIEGSTSVKPAGLLRKYRVEFKKTITIAGLNKLAGIQVTDGVIDLNDEKRNYKGTAVIPNESALTLEIGNVTFANYIEDVNIGTLYIDDLVLAPGVNNVRFTASLDQLKVLDLVQGPKYCKTGIAPVKLVGTSVVSNGREIDYFLAGLASANTTVEMDIAGIIKNSLNYTISCTK